MAGKSRAEYIREHGGSEATFNLVDEATVKRLVRDGKVNVPSKSISIPKDKRWNEKYIGSQILQGIEKGEPIGAISNRIFPEIYEKAGRPTDRGLIQRCIDSSVRNARTMTTSAENHGRLDSYKDLADQGVIQKKVWIATPDDRTRESHLFMDGEEVDIDEEFSNELMFPGDENGEPEEVWNCRCTMRDHIVGFMGADGEIYYVDYERDETLHDRQIENEINKRSASDIINEQYIKERQMNNKEYIEWQERNSTEKNINDNFKEKYGCSIDEAYANDRYIEEEKEWLYDIAQKAKEDIYQVQNGYGHCGYIQSADGSKAINDYLRYDKHSKLYTDNQIKETIDAMSRLINTTELNQDIVVDRCAGINALTNMGINVGETGKTYRIGHAFCTDNLDINSIVDNINKNYKGAILTDKGLMSASVSADNNIFSGSDVTFTIIAPKGTNLYVSNNLIESEVVFSQNTKQEIIGAKKQIREVTDYEGKKTKREVIEIILKII